MLRNPVGTSAGIDKHAEIPDPLLALGPSVIEIGGATPYPQDGNPKPRGIIISLRCLKSSLLIASSLPFADPKCFDQSLRAQ